MIDSVPFQDRVFYTIRHFHPSLIFAGKAGTYKCAVPI
jgi:hypothetical protein